MRRTSAIVIGIVAFALLMALRDITPGMWPRAVIAALAGASLAVTLIFAVRKTHSG